VNRFAGWATLVCISFTAYLAADLAHETLGHGAGCLLAGGHVLWVSTTNEFCSLHARLADGAGPVTGILVALLALTWLRTATPKSPPARIFLALLFAFAILWNVGYMVKSGIFDDGDWAFVVAGLEPQTLWLGGLVVVGVLGYIVADRVFAMTLIQRITSQQGVGPMAFTLVALGSAALLSLAGAFFDPQGPQRMWTDALPSSLGAFGIALAGLRLRARLPDLRLALPVSPGWIATGLVSALIFVAVLGPGLRF